MALFSFGKSNGNIAELTSEKTGELIKKLSGKDTVSDIKIPDNVILFTNASGGAGTSTIVSNVAYMMASRGFRTLIIDLNILFPNQHLYFNASQELEKSDLISFINGRTSLGESIEQVDGLSLMYAHNRGILDIINSESNSAVNNFKEGITRLRELFDIVIIDCPMKIENYLCNTAMYLADQIYLVWDEGIGSISNTDKIRRNMANTGIDAYTKLKVILNKRTHIQYSNYPFEKLNMELLRYIPFEPAVISSSLNAEIFCRKASSSSKNAAYFVGCIENLVSDILSIGGYIE
ncbi:MAG: AAA family ATPase [Lachnospiraceae bacterium]|nr:AAA family ATPase [Lachnospiraceae bacterium]